MGGSIVARVGHRSGNRIRYLGTLSFFNLVLSQVDLKIPVKEEGWVSLAALVLQLSLHIWLWWEGG